MIKATQLLHDQALLDLMPTAVYVIDAEGYVKAFNEKACKIWGRTPRIDEHTDEKWCGGYKLFLPDGSHMPHDQTPMVTAVREGAITRNAEVIIQQKGGTETTVLVNISPIRDENGKLVGAVNAFQDVTELVQSRNALVAKQRELERAVEARDTFLSICSHELKTPLTTLKFQTDMAKRKLAKKDASVFDPKHVEEMVMQNDRQLSRLNRLVDDMLDLARLESGKLTMNAEEVNLLGMVRDVLSRFDLKNHPVSISTEEEDITVLCDRYRLEQAVMNLLTNAIKYGSEKPVEIRLKRVENEAQIEVQDSGIGIAAQDHERIFRRFERAVSEKNISGFGLGLYVTKQIIEAHQGNISVDSTLGKGSVFKIRMPQRASS